MQYLLVSDLHYTLRQFDWLHNVAGRYQVVVVAGDHLDLSSSVAFEGQIVVILKYLQRLHARARLGVATDGDTLEVDDTLFTICPWWDGPATRAEVAAQLARDVAARAGRRWVWVYHSPP